MDLWETSRELARIWDLHTLYFGETRSEDVLAVDGNLRGQVAESLRRSRNFEEREQRRDYLDRVVLGYVKGPW